MRSDWPDGILVLHVDDDPDFLEVASTFLERADEDLTVTTEASAAAGLERLAGTERFDCVVSDYDMPGTNGLDFLERVRERHPDLPFVLFTGKGSEEIASEAISAGVTDYLQKETGTEQYTVLANRIGNVVEGSRSETVLRRTEERYRTLVDSSPAPIVVYDSEGIVVEANGSAAAFVGGDRPDDLVGERALEFIHPDERADSKERVRQVLREGEPAPPVERRVVGFDGEVKHAVLTAAPVPFGDGTAGQVVIQDVTGFREREAALESTSTLLSTLVENTPVGILAEDEDRRVLFTNRPFCDLFGFDIPPEEFVGRDCTGALEAVVDRLREPERFVEATTDAVEAGRVIDREEFEFVDGRVIERSSTPVPLEGGERGYLWVYHDVTEWKRAESRFRTLFENLPDPAVIVELTGGDAITRSVNGAFEEVFGFDEETAIGTSINDLVVPEEDDSEARRIDSAARSGEQVVREVRRLTAEGELRDFLFRNVFIDEADGTPMAHGIYTDITRRKRRERRLNALHEASRRLMATETHAEIAEIASDAAEDVLALPLNGVHLHDRDAGGLVPVAITDRTYEVLGEPPVIGPGDGIAWEVYESGEAAVYGDVSEVGEAMNPETPIRSELYLPLGDHGVFLAGSTEPDDFGSVDVTLAKVLSANVEAALERADREHALKEREGELERQNRRLEEFANVVSHDLRNPLSVAEGNLDLARETGEAEFFDAVGSAHDRMRRLIDDLLDLARQGRAIGEPRPVPLPDVAREAWTNVETGDLELSVEADSVVSADRERLCQLLENLFRNAAEHGRPDGDRADAVRVTVGALDDREGFYVADTGPGIPAEERGRVLESGYSTAEEGTGFGLAIVETIAEAHGWMIGVGEGETGGARFEILTAPTSRVVAE